MSSFPDWFATFRSDRRRGAGIAGLALVCLGVPLLWDPGTVHFSAFKRIMLFVGAAFFLVASAPKTGEGRPDRIDWLSVGLLGWLLITLIWSPAPGRGLVDASLAALAVALFVGGRRLGRSQHVWRFLPWFVASAGLLLAVWALGEWAGRGDEPRAGLGNTNYLAGLLAAQLPFVLLVASKLRSLRSGADEARFLGILLQAAVWVVIVSAILVTHSRAALAAAILAWCLWMVRAQGPLARWRFGRLAVMVTMVVGTAVGLFLFGGSGLTGRLYLAKISLGLIGKSIWFGHGLGSYATIFPEAQGKYLAGHPADLGLWTNAWTAHCEPLQLWIEGGLVGLGAAMLFGWWVFRRMRRDGRDAVGAQGKETPSAAVRGWFESAEVLAASLAGLAALGVTMFSEGLFHQPAQAGLGALWLGLALGLGSRDAEEARNVEAGRLGSRVWNWALWVVLGLLVLGSGVCSVRQYVAERSWGRSLRNEQPARELAAIQTARRWACDPGPILFRESLLLDRVGRRRVALPLMRRALDARPGALRYLALANLLARMGRIDEALSAYEKSLRLHPRLAAAYYNLGLVLEGAGHARRARRMLQRAHSLLPGRYPRPK